MDNEDNVICELIKLSNCMIEEIATLKAENQQLRGEVNSLGNMVTELAGAQKMLLNTIDRNQQETKLLATTMVRSVNNVPYELEMGNYQLPRIASAEVTVEKLISDRASIVRFGDGEFSIMSGASRQGFQRQDDKLAKRLREVIKAEGDNLLVAIANNYGSLSQYTDSKKNEIRFYMTDEVRRSHNQFLDMNRLYYDAYMTTPYLMYADRDSEAPGQRYDRVRKIWEGRHVVIVEGELTRFGVGSDLLDNAADIIRILGPAEHAFDKYDELLSRAIEHGSKIGEDVLFLIALGPTATVLAYDLYCRGFQAIDIGHMGNDYDYFRMQAKELTDIPGKYVNNVNNGDTVADVTDEKYLSQITERIY